ncbi:MAG TPA: hypothetical protein VF989_19240 [Polyangiaceae bacterium]
MSELEAMEESEAEALRKLLRSTLQEPKSSPDVLPGVQRKLRKRSQGKFYRDEWSTARHAPEYTYLITSLLMLAIAFAAYAVLHPLSSEAKVTPMTPQPVNVVPPSRLAPLPRSPSKPAPTGSSVPARR